MTKNTNAPNEPDWLESSGLFHILRTFKSSVHPSQLLLALGGIFCTLILGAILDWVWTGTGNAIPADALANYVARADAAPGSEGDTGVFTVFRGFELHCLRDAIESVRYGRLLGAPRVGSAVEMPPLPMSDLPARGVFADLVLMGRGLTWMVTQHFFFAVLFLLGIALIWGFFGGAISRMAAVQHTRDETVSLSQAFKFTRERLFGGFFMAPIIPLLIILGIGIALIVGGLVLRIPYVGGLVGGLTFFLAVIGGFVIAMVVVGTVGGGSLFWPTIAVEGTDCFDAISRSYSYLFGRPIRLVWYAVLAIVYGGFCWLVVQFVLWLAVASTHLFVDFGSGGTLSSLWLFPTFESLYAMSPDARQGWSRFTSGALIGLWLLPVFGLAWAFLASYFFTGSTVIYLLLRRDVDGTDMGEIYLDEDEAGALSGPGTLSASPPAGMTKPAPAANEPDPPAGVQAESAPAPVKTEAPEPAPPLSAKSTDSDHDDVDDDNDTGAPQRSSGD